MFCKNCGKEIDNNAAVCIHCGVATKNGLQEKPKKANGFGIAGFIISLLSLWFNSFLLCIPSVIGLIFSSVGLAIQKKHSANGLAIAGLVINIFSLVIWGILLLFLGSLLGFESLN